MKKSIFIFNDGQLERRDNTVFFQCDDTKKFIPVEDTADVYIFGEVDASKRFLELCSQHHIPLHYFNFFGYYSGTFYPREHYNSGFMLVEQTKTYIDESARLSLARCFVEGALKNILQVLRYYAKRGKEIARPIEEIEAFLPKLALATDIPVLMGFEGNARHSYYSAFDTILELPDFPFERRSRQPPLNRLNSLISFGNSILYTVVLSEIYKTHLDPRIGYLHTSNQRRFSLNLDLAEIFKPFLVDRTILKLLGKKMLAKKHFEKDLERLYLTEEGRKIFVQDLEERLQTTFYHPKLRRNVSYRTLIRLEVFKVQKHILQEEVYEPFIAPW